MVERNIYTVRMLSIADGQWHECSSSIVAVLGSSYNTERHVWYITALIRRSVHDAVRFGTEEGHGIPEEDTAAAGG